VAAPVPVTVDEQSIRDLVARWHAATAAGDVDTVLQLMADDVVFLVAGQPPMQGRSTFEQRLRGLLQSHRIVSTGDIQEVQVSGNLAYCWSIVTVRIAPLSGGNPVVRSGNALSILRKDARGEWVVARDANLLSVVS
jgi:uncharacterized protein (TIGR02246 family)